MTPSPDSSSTGLKSPELHSLEPPDGRIAHTLTACTRCRHRKSRCDPGIPRCAPCERSNAKCVYYDSTRDTTIPRTYILSLREKARALERELAKAENEVQHAADAELMVRGAGRIRFKENDEPRYLGASSGIAMTRLVMEMAKQNTDSKSIKDVVPEFTAQEIKDAFTQEDSKPTSKVYPMISSIPQPNLPPKTLTYKLIDLFVAKAQALLPLLHEPTFRQEVEEVFNGSTDPCKNFQLRMVIAISMQKMSTEYAGLADSYYLAALPYLEPTLKRLDLGALQCLVLIASYSMVTPTRTAAYWVVGTAAKLCQDLGLTEEATVTKSPCGKPLNPLEIDMRRRLFWIVSSMEFGLSHSLGRCSSYCVSHDHINVKFFELVDDRYITAEGITPGAKPVLAKCIAVHFFKMRLLQLEPRRMLYSNRRESPVDDQDPWFSQMLAKIDHWMATTPKNDDGSGLNVKWFQGRRNTIIVLMYRPSPQIPEPTVNAAKTCYDAAISNIAMHKEQMITGSVDLTWVFVQALFMALNTVLWTLSYPEIRKEHTIEEVQGHLDMAMEVIVFSAERWPGVQSAFLLYRRLVAACLKAYRTEESFVVHSPSNHPTPTSSQGLTPPAMSSPSSSTTASYYSNNHRGNLSIDTASNGTCSRAQSADPTFAQESTPPAVGPRSSKEPQVPSVSCTFDMQRPITAPSVVPHYTPAAYSGPTLYPDLSIDPNTPYNTIPSVVPGLQGWDPNFSLASTTAGHLAYTDATVNPMNWSSSIADQYSQYFHEPFPVPSWRERTLSQQEQIELLASLEHNIPDVSAQLVNEYNAYYQS
ncbi:transcriptional regulator family: Fungal Specific TF [Penicillium roqueforti]|nr:transcriptional regulator family: Fungal Specific TF [Penicillium roqueforti]KAI3109574.1 transcriptional regulator family: Fungal Specific TF [Penicillium roqueforti]KAI3109839.1 transcriptional regulator family: Fungal Specific TF [Penicillium roqueforti]KAI3135184.1 transcriptional regulator family: Fungal Specific TF [Penicillium roqueforti]KAI3140930.1 transcriptional regulator family: Fungal Specific TF [Penicillium roqueforti]